MIGKVRSEGDGILLSIQCKARHAIAKRDEKQMMQGPKRVISVLLSVVVLSAGFLDAWSYDEAFYNPEPGIWMNVVSGTANAPNQYRIAVVDTAYFLARQMHLGMRHTLALLDVVAAFIAVFALLLVLRRSAVYRNAGGRRSGSRRQVLLFWFSLFCPWLLWYQRPETLPTAAILALALLLLAVMLPVA